MQNKWIISVPSSEARKIDALGGDPAQMLAPVKDYAFYTLPKAFTNFEILLPLLRRPGEGVVLDVTVFYSRRRFHPVKGKAHDLSEHNHQAYNAAKNVGGLLIYFQGMLIDRDEAGELDVDPDLDIEFIPDCMSFCIWESLEKAKSGAHTPAHKEAASKAHLWYENFTIRKMSISIKKNTKAGKEFEEIILSRQ